MWINQKVKLCGCKDKMKIRFLNIFLFDQKKDILHR